jgi:myo-inositol 2-dehydrogenase/D-chiro-inositol 1-dehydrogenase
MKENTMSELKGDPMLRRTFLKTSLPAAGAVTFASLGIDRVLGATQGSDTIRIGILGCGGRGTGAARNCLEGAPGVAIVAVADMLRNQAEIAAEQFKVAPDHVFSGLDAYQHLVKTDVDLVIMATPPGFRPMHFKAAIEAGKHVFMEKPVAVDPVGCRLVMEVSNLAKEKKLAVVAGTQRRHQAGYIETMKRIHGGDIGELVGGQCYWLGGGIWFRMKEGFTASLSDLEWQCYNWYHWDWLSGDQVVEQHIHNIDVMNWCFNGPPSKFLASGGRQNRDADILPLVKDSPDFQRMGETNGHPNILGNIYDHTCAELEYANGARIVSMGRHAPKSANRVGERIVGTKGVSNCSDMIQGEKPYSYTEKQMDPFVLEHTDLIRSIRAGEPLNEGVRVAESTLTAIGIRMSAYTGREFSWEWLSKSSMLEIFPKEIKPGPGIFPPVAIPGTTPLL